MKRRTVKKQIRRLSRQLIALTQKYLDTNSHVHRGIISRYELEIELGMVALMQLHLILDSSWPHRERWLDGVSEEFLWERKNGIAHGTGELFWGHWPEVSRDYWVKIYCNTKTLPKTWSRIPVPVRRSR